MTEAIDRAHDEESEETRLRPGDEKPSPWTAPVEWAARLGIGALLAYAGLGKLADTRAFATEIANYQLAVSLSPYLAVTLPAVEIVIAVSLLFGPRRWMRAGALASAIVFVVFTLAVGSVVARGIDVSCGCFGGGSGNVTWLTIARNVALVISALVLWVVSKRRVESA